ncbi:MAG TPA: hypothetical protein VFE14_08000 [Micromonosporaceae bacterium]|jgi:hypothetical protein|nr:hypothetical protein [Micromonosporaceae bacterium]
MATAVRAELHDKNGVRGLSPQDLVAIRDTLANGRKPRVQFTETAGQVAGQTGQVVELTDPALSDEWVVVRFGKDELPFSPADLAMPGKVPAARRAEPKSVEPPPVPELKVVREKPTPTPRQEKSVPQAVSSTVESPVVPAQPAATKPRKAAKVKAPAALTVTLAYADGEWTVAAQQGSKALAKPYSIKPSEALKMVGMLDVPGVHEAVEHILSAERTEAEQQAERLRAELSEIEAKLAELRAAS